MFRRHFTIRATWLIGVLLFANAVLLSPLRAVGQCTFDWKPGEGLPGPNGPVYAATTWDPDGAGPQPDLLILGGYFSAAGEIPVNNIAAWDGNTWLPLGSGVNDGVSELTVYNGELIAAGIFTIAGNISANSIARWNGTSWSALGSGIRYRLRCGYCPASIYALAVYNGDLIAGGFFHAAGEAVADYIARWDGSSWSQLGTGIDSDVNALVVFNGELIAGGRFSAKTARWNGSSWTYMGFGPVFDAKVRSLCVYNGELYGGGDGNWPHVARWTGSGWSILAGMEGSAYALAVYNGVLVAGADFGPAWNAYWNGSSWTPMDTPGGVRALTVYRGELIAGTLWGGYAFRWNGSSTSTLGNSGTDGSVTTFTTYEDDIVVGGRFSVIGGTAASRVARWDGTNFAPLGGGMDGDFDDAVLAFAAYNGDLIAGGRFTTAEGAPANLIARWDGSGWSPLGGGLTSPNNYNRFVSSLIVHKGELIAGGSFSYAGGTPVINIARWNGTAWSGLGSGLNSGVFALAIYNGELIAGTGSGNGGVVRWDGVSWSALRGGVNGAVYALAVYSGELIAAGSFTTAGGLPANRIARWNGTILQRYARGQ